MNIRSQITKIVSGAQTGVDRAALDIANELGIESGGWCPRGRIAEDGVIPAHYPVVETPSAEYAERTKWNVRDSDATLIVTADQLCGGSLETSKAALELSKPVLVADPRSPEQGIYVVQGWLAENRVTVLNIAGPRESTAPGIYELSKSFLRNLFTI